MDRRTGGTERCSQLGEIIRIAGQNVVSQAEGQVDEMTVHDIRRLGDGQKPTYRRTIIE